MTNRTTTINLAGQGLSRFAFAPDGRLAYTTRDGSFVTYDAETGAETSVFLGVTLGDFAFLSDGSVVSVLAGEVSSTVYRFAPGGTDVDRIELTVPDSTNIFGDADQVTDVVVDADGRVVFAHLGEDPLWTTDLDADAPGTFVHELPQESARTGDLLSRSETGEHLVALNTQTSGADVTVLDVTTGRSYRTDSIDTPALSSFHRHEAAVSSERGTVLIPNEFDLVLFDTRLSVLEDVSDLDTVSTYGGAAVSEDGTRFFVLNLAAEAVMMLDARDLSFKDAFAVDLFADNDSYRFLEDGSLSVTDGDSLFAIGTDDAIMVVDRDFAEAPATSYYDEWATEEGGADVALSLQLGTAADDALSGDDVRSRGFELFGGDGDDTLTGASSNDLLVGGSQDDVLVGLGGTDTLRGGRGRDTFVFGDEGGRDDVLDFRQGSDLIDLTGVTGVASLDDLQVVRVGADLTISLTSRDSVRLVGFAGELAASDFVFASLPTEGADALVGTDADDVIDGLGGDDTIEGGLGSDVLTGGAGDDVLYGDLA